MGAFTKIKGFITNPQIRFGYMTKLGIFNKMDDEKYLKKAFKVYLGKDLDLGNPETFNEKLQWLKLYDCKPEYTTMVDKYASKKYVADLIGEEYVIPCVGGPWKSVDEIDFDSLPNQFVLKTNHDCGGVVICKDKSTFDFEKAKEVLASHLKRDYYITAREWPYKNVERCIFAESFMKDGERNFLPVYKIMCFGGEPKIIQTIQNDKQPDETIDYFDTEWEMLPFRQNFPNSQKPLEKPAKLDEMLSIARKLSKGHSFLRVDVYVINGDVYFSEFTFFSDAGLAAFEPKQWDYTLGSWIKLKNTEEE